MTYRIPLFSPNPSKSGSGNDQPTTGKPKQDKPPKDIRPILKEDKKPEKELELKFVDLGGGERARVIRQLYKRIMRADVSQFNPARSAEPRTGMCPPLSHVINQVDTALDQIYQHLPHEMGLKAAEHLKDWHHKNLFGTYPGSSPKHLVLQVKEYYTPKIEKSEIPVGQDVLDQYLPQLNTALDTIDEALSQLVGWISTHWEDKNGNQHSSTT